MHYPLIHHQYRAVWSIAFRSKRLYHISILPFPCSDTSWELTSMESKCNVNKHHKSSEIDSFETWHITKTTQIGLWSHCRCYVGQYIYAFAILTVFVLSHAISTQHPETFHPASPLFFLNFPPSINPLLHALKTELIFPLRVCSSATHLFKNILFKNILFKTVHFYSTKNTSMNKFFAQISSPCLILGGIPPASLSEGWLYGHVVPRHWNQPQEPGRLRGQSNDVRPRDQGRDPVTHSRNSQDTYSVAVRIQLYLSGY